MSSPELPSLTEIGDRPEAGSALVSLARLADVSGGQFTERTSDLGLGVARAQQDLACVYSIGFHDADPGEQRSRSVRIGTRRAGLRVVHPTELLVRSARGKRESLVRAAYLSPASFETGVLRAHVFPIRPQGKDRWEALVTVSFPMPLALAGEDRVEREFGGVVSSGSRVVHRFSRKIRLEPTHPGVSSEPRVTFLESVKLRPGTYSMQVVLDDPSAGEPHSVAVEFALPEVPKQGVFILGPILWRRAGSDLVVRAGAAPPVSDGAGPGADAIGEWNSFQPVLVQAVDAQSDLVALTEVCVAGGKKKKTVQVVRRTLRFADGRPTGTLDPVEVNLQGDRAIRCHSLVDILPIHAIRGGGDFVFEATAGFDLLDPAQHGEVRFSVSAPAPVTADALAPAAPSR